MNNWKSDRSYLGILDDFTIEKIWFYVWKANINKVNKQIALNNNEYQFLKNEIDSKNLIRKVRNRIGENMDGTRPREQIWVYSGEVLYALIRDVYEYFRITEDSITDEKIYDSPISLITDEKIYDLVKYGTMWDHQFHDRDRGKRVRRYIRLRDFESYIVALADESAVLSGLVNSTDSFCYLTDDDIWKLFSIIHQILLDKGLPKLSEHFTIGKKSTC